MPRVSVITPAYNAEATLAETVASVRQQQFQDYEHLIIDDGSSDLTAKIVEDISRLDSRVRLLRLDENKGAAVARNVGIEAAKGDFITFIDSDDLWLPHKLSKQIEFMEGQKIPFSYSAYERIDNSGNKLGIVGVPEKVCYKELLKTCVIGCLTVAYDVRCFGKVYMPPIRMRQDYGLWLKLLKQIDFAYGITEPLALYRINKGSLSRNKIKAARYTWKVYRDLEKLGLIESGYYFAHYAIRGTLRLKYPGLAKKLGALH